MSLTLLLTAVSKSQSKKRHLLALPFACTVCLPSFCKIGCQGTTQAGSDIQGAYPGLLDAFLVGMALHIWYLQFQVYTFLFLSRFLTTSKHPNTTAGTAKGTYFQTPALSINLVPSLLGLSLQNLKRAKSSTSISFMSNDNNWNWSRHTTWSLFLGSDEGSEKTSRKLILEG